MDNQIFTEKQKQALIIDDVAFLNSVLSYGIYTEREWITELKDSRVDFANASNINTEKILSKSEDYKNNYENYIYAYFKNNFKSVDIGLKSGTFKSDNYGYETEYKSKESDYLTLDNLARAGYFLTINKDGSKNLHLTFRGTDDKAKPFGEFVGKAYLDMSAYYEAFKPLEDAILKYAADPKNNIKEIQVSGHSLGGAMVQEFFKSPNVMSSDLEFKGFTYGAPGSNKKLIYGSLSEVYHAVKVNTFTAFKNIAKNILPALAEKFMPKSMVYKIAGNIEEGDTGVILPISRLESIKNKNIHQYQHAADLIPKAGSIIYRNVGDVIKLDDVASENAKENWMLTGETVQAKAIKYIKNIFAFKYHDMTRYMVNIEMKMDKIIMGNEKLKELTPNLNKFLDNKDIFLSCFEEVSVSQTEKIRKLEKETSLAKIPKISQVIDNINNLRGLNNIEQNKFKLS